MDRHRALERARQKRRLASSARQSAEIALLCSRNRPNSRPTRENGSIGPAECESILTNRTSIEHLLVTLLELLHFCHMANEYPPWTPTRVSGWSSLVMPQCPTPLFAR